MIHSMKLVKWLTIAGFLGLSFSIQAKEYSLKEILAMSATPHGVVIEIVTGDDAGLSWALPKSQKIIQKLRDSFTDLPIAIVTHGREQFALTKKRQNSSAVEHDAVNALMKDSKVQVHVCGTFAGWRGLNVEDFPEYVNVSAAGPAQINDYKSLGYLLLVVRSNSPLIE